MKRCALISGLLLLASCNQNKESAQSGGKGEVVTSGVVLPEQVISNNYSPNPYQPPKLDKLTLQNLSRPDEKTLAQPVPTVTRKYNGSQKKPLKSPQPRQGP